MFRKIIAFLLAICSLFSSALASALPDGVAFRLANDARFRRRTRWRIIIWWMTMRASCC